jgi:hypothetical protein
MNNREAETGDEEIQAIAELVEEGLPNEPEHHRAGPFVE